MELMMWSAADLRDLAKHDPKIRARHRRCTSCGLYVQHRNAARHGKACRKRKRAEREKAAAAFRAKLTGGAS